MINETCEKSFFGKSCLNQSYIAILGKITGNLANLM